MNYQFAIDQFENLIEDIIIAKQDPTLDFVGHDVNTLHQRCEVLIRNFYHTANTHEPSQFEKEVSHLKQNDARYNGFNRLAVLQSLAENIVVDLKIKEKIANDQNETNNLKTDVSKLAMESETPSQEKKELTESLNEFRQKSFARQGIGGESGHKHGIQEYRMEFRGDARIEQVGKFRRVLFGLNIFYLTIINILLPFALNKFNWIVTGVAEAIVLAALLISLFKPTLPDSKFWKEQLVSLIISIVSTIAAAFVIFKLGWNK